MGKSNDELLKELIAAFQPRLRELVEEIINEKLRDDPRAFDDLDGAGLVKDRRSFLKRSITK
jgi:hypothetical protein